ncbi:OB-fold nucleic acid binding domain-containing protein [Aquipuribacter nitratireducens]|uniref:OB-fold nucleic acid binding domain-containing protein n=1 Tax=Aquipuribacter nitratireducens TaxID=650104 RepID=A0ABW0GKW6_9MICO
MTTDRAWRRALASLTRSDDELAARRQAEAVGRLGGTPVVDLPGRCRATLCGTLRSVTVEPAPASCHLEAELFDGSGTVRLRWIGRSAIPGVEPGRQLRVTGTVSRCDDGSKVIYNPAYELLPART